MSTSRRSTPNGRSPSSAAKGAYLFDSDGRRYLDAMSNYGVAILGHADPEYAAALSEQLHTLATGHQSFYSDVRAELLREIAEIAPAG